MARYMTQFQFNFSSMINMITYVLFESVHHYTNVKCSIKMLMHDDLTMRGVLV